MKKKQRLVRVDSGYGPAEHWETAKVIQSRMVKQLFSDDLKENLLVELMGGERVWVDSWEEYKVLNNGNF